MKLKKKYQYVREWILSVCCIGCEENELTAWDESWWNSIGQKFFETNQNWTSREWMHFGVLEREALLPKLIGGYHRNTMHWIIDSKTKTFLYYSDNEWHEVNGLPNHDAFLTGRFTDTIVKPLLQPIIDGLEKKIKEITRNTEDVDDNAHVDNDDDDDADDQKEPDQNRVSIECAKRQLYNYSHCIKKLKNYGSECKHAKALFNHCLHKIGKLNKRNVDSYQSIIFTKDVETDTKTVVSLALVKKKVCFSFSFNDYILYFLYFCFFRLCKIKV